MKSAKRWVVLASLIGCALAVSAGQAGKDWGVERESHEDLETGVRVWELTKPGSVADNLYFHFSNFTADNTQLIFVSDRTGSRQLYRSEVTTGRITQITDDPGINASSACPDPLNPRRVYCLRGAEILALDIFDFTSRAVGTIPKPYVGGFQQPTVDGEGRWMALGKQRDESNWEIGLMRIETGEYKTVLTQGFRVTHVQMSPKDSVIFYVWETGGYAPQRTWVVNTDGSGNRPFYARTSPTNWFTPLKEWVTHEAWIAGTGEMTMINDKLGVMIVDVMGNSRLVLEGNYWHVAARPDGRCLVMDDAQGRLWLARPDKGDRRLLTSGIRDTVRVHGHPSFDRRGRYVQFHTGRKHETVALIDLAELPELKWTQ